jgi:hypothetical protein
LYRHSSDSVADYVSTTLAQRGESIESNAAAHGLYARLGYRERMREPIVRHPLIRCAGDAILMVKPL